MNILLWYWGKRGGGAKYTLEIAKTLAKLSDVKLNISLSKQNELYNQFAAINCQHCDIDTFTSPAGAIINLRQLWKYRQQFKQFLQQQQIDLVICPMIHVWNIFFVDILNELNIRYVLVMHDAHAHPGEQSRIRNWLEHYEVKRTQGLIALTETVKQQLITRFHYPAEKIQVIPLGIFDYNQGKVTEPRKLDLTKPVKLLFFGRIIRYKGLDLLLAACLPLQQQQFDFELYIVGEGDLTPYQVAIDKLGKNVIVDNRWIADEEIYDIFHDKDIVVLPYIEASQSGVVAIAMGFGIPIIATKVGGLSEQIADGETGVLASITPLAINTAIRKLRQETDIYQHISLLQTWRLNNNSAWRELISKFWQA